MALLAVGALVIVVLGAGGYAVLQDRREDKERKEAEELLEAEATERADLGAAIAEGDLDAVGSAAADGGQAVEPDKSLQTGEDEDISLNDAGYAVLEVTLEGDTDYLLTSDPALEAVLVDASDVATVATDEFSAPASGDHLLLVASPERSEGRATVRIDPISVTSVDPFGEGLTGETVALGAAADYTVDATAEEVYGIEIDSDGDGDLLGFDTDGEVVSFEVFGPDGATVETETDLFDQPRFRSTVTGTYRVRVRATGEEAAEFSIHLPEKRYGYWFYTPADGEYRSEPNLGDIDFDRSVDTERRICAFVLQGRTLTFVADPEEADRTVIIDVHDDGVDGPGRYDPGRPRLDRVRAEAPGQAARVNFTDDASDRFLCLRVWVEGNAGANLDFTGSFA